MSDEAGGGIPVLLRVFSRWWPLSETEVSSLSALLPDRERREEEKRRRERSMYPHPAAHYAAIFDVTARGVNKWIARGLAADPPEPPPLDDPSALVGWWPRHMKHRVPERLLIAKREFEAKSGVPRGTEEPLPDFALEAESAVSVAAGPVEPIEVAPLEGSANDEGFFASLLRTRRAERVASLAYEAAKKAVPRNEADIRITYNTWKDIAQQLRSMEKDAPEILKKTGDMWLSVDIVSELTPMLTSLKNGVDSLWRRFSVKIGVQSTVATDRIWQDEVDRLFAGLLESKFVKRD